RSSTNSRRSYGSRLDARSRRSVPSRRGAVAEFKTPEKKPDQALARIGMGE
ncbi:unnamed protein product, partial [Effrenium voratum]